MKVVILCGGMGTRLKEETEFKPKSLVEVGGVPILWHIMKIYSSQGFNDFILCLGYKGDMIKEYFLNYYLLNNSFTYNLKSKKVLKHEGKPEDWNITFADTGEKTLVTGRIKKIQKYIKEDTFMITYGDGVADINLTSLLRYHQEKKKVITITGIHPSSKYGMVDIDENGLVMGFRQKPKLRDLVNGGFFVCNKKFFDYLKKDADEEEVFVEIAKQRQMALYKHEGFWACMDTFKDAQSLNDIWNSGKVPWKIWKD